ncbi:MAG: phosphoheptose isomerase [Halioglobus sp.]|nr:phosphoheptose isomerase [Halioglobus sp.]
MDYYQTIAGSFQATIEAAANSVDALAAPIERAARLMTDCLLGDHKIVACGNGADAAMAQLFSGQLLGHHARERPALPALTLGGDSAGLTALARAGAAADAYARQLRALGQAGDLMLYINSGGSDDSLLRAVRTARERNLTVVALSNVLDDGLAGQLGDTDVLLRVEAPRSAAVRELQLMVINCLCALVDQGLFGNYSEE